MDDARISRKQRLMQWKAHKTQGTGSKANGKLEKQEHKAAGKTNRRTLEERLGSINAVQGTVSSGSKRQGKRKPFQVSQVCLHDVLHLSKNLPHLPRNLLSISLATVGRVTERHT